jgi:hypothetical protein
VFLRHFGVIIVNLRLAGTSPASKTAASTFGRKHGSRSERLTFVGSFGVVILLLSMLIPVLQDGPRCALACLAVYVEHQSPITSLCLHSRFALLFTVGLCLEFANAMLRSGCKLLSSDELGNINEWYPAPRFRQMRVCCWLGPCFNRCPRLLGPFFIHAPGICLQPRSWSR